MNVDRRSKLREIVTNYAFDQESFPEDEWEKKTGEYLDAIAKLVAEQIPQERPIKAKTLESKVEELSNLLKAEEEVSQQHCADAVKLEGLLKVCGDALKSLLEYSYSFAMVHHAYCRLSDSKTSIPNWVRIDDSDHRCICEERKRYLKAKEALSEIEKGQKRENCQGHP